MPVAFLVITAIAAIWSIVRSEIIRRELVGSFPPQFLDDPLVYGAVIIGAGRGVSGRRASFVRPKIRWIVFLVILLQTCSLRLVHAEPDGFDKESFYRAVRYCRQNALRDLGSMSSQGPLSLNPDKRILCFDGPIAANLNVSLARSLAEGGLFVVRSNGGMAPPAIELSDIIRDRRAKVVVYDYCYSACALFFLVASYETYVLRGALVAWHNTPGVDTAPPLCTFLVDPHDGGGPKLQRGPCIENGGDAISGMFREFFKDRAVSPFQVPPDSRYVRRRLVAMYADSGVARDIAWTIHPRYYSRLFKTKIVYEAYPESQSEVDDMAAAWPGPKTKIIYDP